MKNAKKLPSKSEMLRIASADSDPATVFYMGADVASQDGCVVIVKGGANAFRVRGFLVSAGLLTPGKRLN